MSGFDALGFDPTPGDVGVLRGFVAQLDHGVQSTADALFLMDDGADTWEGAAAAAFRVAGAPTLAGGLLAALGAALVQPGHIYPGLGTTAMLLLAGGYLVMAWLVVSRSAPREARRTLPSS